MKVRRIGQIESGQLMCKLCKNYKINILQCNCMVMINVVKFIQRWFDPKIQNIFRDITDNSKEVRCKLCQLLFSCLYLLYPFFLTEKHYLDLIFNGAFAYGIFILIVVVIFINASNLQTMSQFQCNITLMFATPC